MNDHYYSREPESASRPAACDFEYRGKRLRFETDAGVFSRGEVDEGSRLLLKNMPADLRGDVLDLGCGWGALGVSLGKAFPETRITMTDVNLRALELSRRNAEANGVRARCLESDGLAALQGCAFDMIVTNPPIRAGKAVIYRLFSEAAEALKPEGALYLVIRKQQGAESCLKYLKTLFASAERIDRDGGFWILRAAGALT